MFWNKGHRLLLTNLLPVPAACGGLHPNRPVTRGVWFEECWSGRKQRLETGRLGPVRQQLCRYPQWRDKSLEVGDHGGEKPPELS